MNKKREVKYVGFYDLPDSNSGRVCNLAAINKMNYVSSAINRAGYSVNIISPSWMEKNTMVKSERQNVKRINDQTIVTFCPSWATRNKFSRNIKIFFSLIWLCIYLIFNTKKSEKVLAYHVQWISLPIRIAKFFKRFELILEVEEIYCEVWKTPTLLKSMERKLLNIADSYILVSELLKEHLIIKNKKYLVLYGSYNVFPKRKKNSGGKIKVIYAGSIETTKGGAFKAIELMRHLSDNYKLYIIGHGSTKNIISLKSLIKDLNIERNCEMCVYDGVLHGQDYSEYICQVDIALNPQNQGEYMKTAFPSKVLSYLSHNLRVVSTPIESIKSSSVSNFVTFAKDDSPEELANAVSSIDLSFLYDSTRKIEQLDNEFVENINEFLES